jgi:BirA family biotin operon repressor/biotin-[acetyl-CoA-carboxylase] ligase
VTIDHASLQLISELSDGRFHSGEIIAQRLGISRAAVWKRLQRMQQQLGLELHAVRGRGYRLAAPIELLDSETIRSAVPASARHALDSLCVVPSIDSTNRAALADPPICSGVARAWLAEHQTAGRGRRGRHWVSVFGGGLYLSLAWRFDCGLAELSGLSLLTGVVVAETLDAHGVSDIGLKWPNDVLLDERKLCGILVEAVGEADGPATAVIGIGLNMRMSKASAADIDQPWTDLAAGIVQLPSRNALAAALLSGLIEACRAFGSDGASRLVERWRRYDRLAGRKVAILRADRTVSGTYEGIGADGELLLQTGQGLEAHVAGEVSVRPLKP